MKEKIYITNLIIILLVEMIVDVDSTISLQMQKNSSLWHYNGGKYTVGFDTYKDDNWFKYRLYVFEGMIDVDTF